MVTCAGKSFCLWLRFAALCSLLIRAILFPAMIWSRRRQLNNCVLVLAHSKPSDIHFFLFLHFAFTDKLLSFVINLKPLARWGTFNLNNHLKCRFPRVFQCTRKIFLVCLSWAWLLQFPYLSAVLISANSLRTRFVNWKMADTGPVPDQSVLAVPLDEPGCASDTPKLLSSSTEHSSLAPVTAEHHKEASLHWHDLYHFPLGA